MRHKHKQANYIPENLKEAQKFYQDLPRKKSALDKGAWCQVGKPQLPAPRMQRTSGTGKKMNNGIFDPRESLLICQANKDRSAEEALARARYNDTFNHIKPAASKLSLEAADDTYWAPVVIIPAVPQTKDSRRDSFKAEKLLTVPNPA